MKMQCNETIVRISAQKKSKKWSNQRNKDSFLYWLAIAVNVGAIWHNTNNVFICLIWPLFRFFGRNSYKILLHFWKFEALKSHSEINWPLTQKSKTPVCGRPSPSLIFIGSLDQKFHRDFRDSRILLVGPKWRKLPDFLHLISKWYLKVAIILTQNTKANWIGQSYFIALTG